MYNRLAATLGAMMLCALATAHTAFAQITVTNAAFPGAGDTLKMAVDNSPSVINLIFTPPGGPQTWDLSSLQVQGTQNYIFRAAGEGSVSGQVAGAELVTLPPSPHAEEYYNVTSTRFELQAYYGIAPYDLVSNALFTYGPPLTERQAPLNFFDIYASSSVILEKFPPSAFTPSLVAALGALTAPAQPDSFRYRVAISQTDVVDAWGSLSIPGGTYNVLREKRTRYQETRLDGKYPPLGWLDTTDEAIQAGFHGLGVDTTVSFYFYSDVEKEPIARVTLNNAQNAAAQTLFKYNAPTSPVATTTTLGSSPNPSFTTAPDNAVTFTATVTSGGNPVTSGTVTFTEGLTVLAGPTALNGSGQATFLTSSLTEGSHTITATYNPASGFLTSNGNVTQTVNNHTSVSGNQFCNSLSGITINNSSAATPYPSRIFVSGLSGTITKVTVALTDFSATVADGIDLLLVGPGGQKFLLMSDVGGSGSASNVNLTFDDAAASALPNSALASGTYRPTDNTPADAFPSPAPAGPYVSPAPAGSGTLASVFNGIAPNGTWSLYAVAEAGAQGSVAGGWCLNFTTSGSSVSITVNTTPAGLGFAVDATSYSAEQNFNWTPASSHDIATTSPQSLVAGTRYVFTGWSDGGAISHNVNAPSSATTYTATFKTQHQLTTSASTGGSISPVSGYYDEGNVVITATPDLGYVFTGFSGDLSGTTNPQTLNLTGPASVTATFAAIPPPAKAFVFLANKITLERTKQHTPAGDMHSNGTLTFSKGDPSTYNSNLTAVGKITINKENTINGNVKAPSVSNSGTINGTKTIASVASESLPSLSYSAGGANKSVPSGKSLTLAPSSYGVVTIGSGATLKLTSGEYFMSELRASSSSTTIEITISGNNPATINVVSKLQLGKDAEVRILPGGENDSKLVTFNTLQSTAVNLGKEAYLLGTFNAPNAVVTLVKNSQLRGAIEAKEIVVQRDCLFLEHDAFGSLPGPGNLPKSSGDEDEEVSSEQSSVISDYELAQNYPNPFNPTTTISFALPEASEVSLSIFNTNGQLVKRLVAGEMSAGRHSFTWDATNERGERVSSGVYLYVLKAGGFTAQKKLVLMK